jgi:signal transduction histidine kinase/ActR/RegA family two-component response regulator
MGRSLRRAPQKQKTDRASASSRNAGLWLDNRGPPLKIRLNPRSIPHRVTATIAMVEISTSASDREPLWASPQGIFVRVMLVGALALAVIGATDYVSGNLNTWDFWMLPLMAISCLVSSVLITRSPPSMDWVLPANLFVLVVYCEGLIFQTLSLTDAVKAYTLASTLQVFPGIYVGMFVLMRRHAAKACWLVFASVALQCLYGLVNTQHADIAKLQEQVYWAVLGTHPCTILALSFMSYLRRSLQQAHDEAADARGRLLSMVSHEIRTPLQTIVSSVELFESARTGPPADRALGRIKNATAVLERQVHDLTTFTSLKASPGLLIQPCSPDALLADLHGAYQVPATAKGLSLLIEGGYRGAWVQADQARLRQIMDNLLSNALKYTQAGRVVVGVDRDEGDGCHLWVSDTGRGIAPGQLASVFEPFVRIKSHPQERIEGSGLGLAVVRQLVDAMGGRIHIDSALGQGTTIHLRLPLPITEGPMASSQAIAGKTVLLVDDDADILNSLTEILTALGAAQVIRAVDGPQAVAVLQQQGVDLALIDIELPGCSGYEVAQAARHSPLNRDTPLLAMSAKALSKDAPGFEAFNALLPKPCTKERILNAASQALAAAQWATAQRRA